MCEEDAQYIAGFLIEEFSLKSAEQVERTACSTFGFASDQFKFSLLTNEGKLHNLFIKKLYTEKINSNKELAMYGTFIPELVSFVESVDEILAEKIRSCFIKCYMCHQSTEPDKSSGAYLVLEDFSCRAGDYKYRDIPELVAERLGVIHGTSLAWQRAKHPGVTPGQLLEKYPFFKECYTSETDDPNEDFFIRQTSAVDKMIRSDIELCDQNDGRDTILEKLQRVVDLSPHLARLRHETQKPRQSFFCPTLGDVHAGNIAMSESKDDILFFDFDIVRLSSPLIDFHHFTAGSLKCPPKEKHAQIKKLLHIYIDSFLSTSRSLNNEITVEELLEEYKITRNWFTITSYFVPLLTLEMQGVTSQQEIEFIADINSLDLQRDGEKIQEKVRRLGGPALAFRRNVLQFLEGVETEQLERLETLVAELHLGSLDLCD